MTTTTIFIAMGFALIVGVIGTVITDRSFQDTPPEDYDYRDEL